MIVTFLRTPLESASASQWEYTKWPPQSDESYVMCAFQCRVHVLGQLFHVISTRVPQVALCVSYVVVLGHGVLSEVCWCVAWTVVSERMCFSWARTMLSLADCVEAIKELDRMIVTFLRTPLESASASQWEYTKWPPQSDESYVMCAFD